RRPWCRISARPSPSSRRSGPTKSPSAAWTAPRPRPSTAPSRSAPGPRGELAPLAARTRRRLAGAAGRDRAVRDDDDHVPGRRRTLPAAPAADRQHGPRAGAAAAHRRLHPAGGDLARRAPQHRPLRRRAPHGAGTGASRAGGQRRGRHLRRAGVRAVDLRRRYGAKRRRDRLPAPAGCPVRLHPVRALPGRGADRRGPGAARATHPAGRRGLRLLSRTGRNGTVIASLTGFASLFALCFAGIPLAVAMLIVGVVGFMLFRGSEAALTVAAQQVTDAFTSHGLSVIPLFILMGTFIHRAGLADELFAAARAWLGHFRGGMAHATIGACGGFSAVCGSSIATAATMARVSLPQMKRYGYD